MIEPKLVVDIMFYHHTVSLKHAYFGKHETRGPRLLATKAVCVQFPSKGDAEIFLWGLETHCNGKVLLL